jgi:hypothetical protein
MTLSAAWWVIEGSSLAYLYSACLCQVSPTSTVTFRRYVLFIKDRDSHEILNSLPIDEDCYFLPLYKSIVELLLEIRSGADPLNFQNISFIRSCFAR